MRYDLCHVPLEYQREKADNASWYSHEKASHPIADRTYKSVQVFNSISIMLSPMVPYGPPFQRHVLIAPIFILIPCPHK